MKCSGNNQARRDWGTKLAVTFGLFALVGCSSLGGQYSGFLGDYSQLSPSPYIDGAESYRNSLKNMADYDSFMIEPVQVQFIKGGENVAIDPDKLKELTSYFQDKMKEELRSGGYKVVSRAGSDTLRFRIAIVDLKKTIAALNIHPASKMSGAGLGGASIEAEGLDSSGDRVFAFVHSKKGSRMGVKAGLSTWGHAKQVMDFWAEETVARLDDIKENGTW